jgi:purine-binding chemotaxis protein CheW
MAEAKQFLTFSLGDERFAIDVAYVREILEIIPITRIPRTPPFMLGVINNRGSVVPVVDMRLKFGMGASERTVDTCIIVTEVTLGGEPMVLGALADSVSEVVQLEPGQIDPPPKLGSTAGNDFVKGIGKRDGSFLLILDIDRLFTVEELAFARGSEGQTAAPG